MAQPVADNTACNDVNACTTNDKCIAGTCTGTPVSCNDNINCTTDTCDTTKGCIYTPNTSCVKCWSASNTYLLRDPKQAKKFCKCVTGNYTYSSMSTAIAIKTAYRYTDPSNNTNWATASKKAANPVTAVKCISGGTAYKTNQDYYTAG